MLFVILEIKIIPKVPLVNKKTPLLTSDFPLSSLNHTGKQKAQTALPLLLISALADLNLTYILNETEVKCPQPFIQGKTRNI